MKISVALEFISTYIENIGDICSFEGNREVQESSVNIKSIDFKM